MMKRLSLMFAALTWLVTGQASPAGAVWMNGKAFVEDCLSEDVARKLACVSYITGAADMISVYAVVNPGGGTPAVCIPAETTVGKLQDVVVNHLKANPEETHSAAVVQVTLALHEAFPCQT